jgi:hypothetical protein
MTREISQYIFYFNSGDSLQLQIMVRRGVHSGHRVDFKSGISGRFKIGFYVHIGFYIIVDPFLSRVKSDSVIKSGVYRVFRSVLNNSKQRVQNQLVKQINKIN